ncbi:hypothetical protein [Paenibacillus sp. FJAT-26967]|uniref:hypothetical protein n=1 Tax=Paenibacillus sp. FJAT-26967 TaxID=1729690 RepID=UPI000837FF97|nr:hypothetical protein [Paenibacillus sp. FJAT-26967]
MAGNLRWNFIVGAASFIFTFILSFSDNVWQTTMLRSFYSFVILFILTFVFRFIINLVSAIGAAPAADPAEQSGEPLEDNKVGQHLDLSTPDEAAIPTTDATAREEDGFAPLAPPKLVTRKQPDTEQSVRALRQMSEE